MSRASPHLESGLLALFALLAMLAVITTGGADAANAPSDGLIEGLDWPGPASAANTPIVSAAVFTSSGLNERTVLLQTGFEPLQWSGQLLSLAGWPDRRAHCSAPQAAPACGSQRWDAATVLAAQDWNAGRQILGHHPLSRLGIAFRWDQLSPGQQQLLNRDPGDPSAAPDARGESRLRYLRGDAADVAVAAPGFRPRSTPLGDIVNSEPVHVGAPSAPYGAMAGYDAFRKAHADRSPMVYVGANDGMLHGFDVESGEERIAFVPDDRRIFGDLPWLARQDYISRHRFTVDGPLTVADADTASGWKSVLVGGLRAGGQTIFALDVTEPTRFAESAADAVVLWQFGDQDDADFGYSFGRPSVVRMRDGRFAVVMANGYFSNEGDGFAGDGRACLFILSVDGPGQDHRWDLGADYRKLCAPKSAPADALPYNGLSSPAAVDLDGDQVADAVYAGDLEGHLWKFDVRSSNPQEWQLAYGGQALFQACSGRCGAGTAQAITARPEVGAHPSGMPAVNGVLVYFGTGQDFLAAGHELSSRQNSLYMVQDLPAAGGAALPLQRAALQRQEILGEQAPDGGSCSSGGRCLRRVSSNPVILAPDGGPSSRKGWYLDLPAGGSHGGMSEGLTIDPVLRGSRISYATVLPKVAGCRPCSESWLMELDFRSGGRTSRSSFDANGDGLIGALDLVHATSGDVPAGGLRLPAGLAARSAVLSLPPDPARPGGDCREFRYQPGPGGTVSAELQACGSATGRQSWRQIR